MSTVAATSRLLNPARYDAGEFDPATQRLLRATIEWFEAKGKTRLMAEVRTDEWYSDFIDFLARERAFATLLTPARDAGGDPDKRWDTRRNAVFNELLGFYGLPYWYAWQVTILGLGPIWQSANDAARERAARLLEDGAVFAFGLSERDHGADIYSTDMVLTPDGDGFRANGGKYYIGNGNVAGMVSVFGRRADVEGPEGYVFFAADSRHPAYKLRKNVVHAQMYVSAFDLEDYPVAPQDILHAGVEAFEAALNTVNVGKFNLGFCAIGMAEHCFYETTTQAENRRLYGKRVTEFGQVRRILTEAYARLLATKLFGARAVDYVRSASLADRRYLLYTPINKMRVTMEGERIVSLLGEVISAKGFERDTYFEAAKNIIGGLPKLEGTVHVNLALTLKFLPNYLFGNEAALEPAPVRHDTADDEFLFAQGPTRGLSKIRFPDWRPIFDAFAAVPNVMLFREQAEALAALPQTAPLTPEQMTEDLDFQQSLAQLFTLVPWGQLVLEQAQLTETPSEVVDLIFEWLVRDFTTCAIDLHGKASSTDAQQRWVLASIRKPVIDPARDEAIYAEVRALAGAYVMPD